MPASARKRPLPRTGILRHALLGERYLRKDDQGQVVESRIEMFHRVANAVAEAEAMSELGVLAVGDASAQFFGLMASGQFLPNSPTLMNAGRKGGVLSACFVLPVNDSVEEIFASVKDAALVQKAGGGTGFAFDHLRPTGDRVASSGGTTSGPMSFVRVFDESTNAIQQGSARRGANMGMMALDHPDIPKFITAKAQAGILKNFNLSVKVTDAFMQALKYRPDEPHLVINPRDGQKYLIPRDVDIQRYGIQDLLPAGAATKPCYTVRDVWDLIAACAHAAGEPGLCFTDRVNRDNPTPALGRIEATNPCGEQPLLDYEACTLGSINLAKFVDRKVRRVRWGALRNAIRLAISFLFDPGQPEDRPGHHGFRRRPGAARHPLQQSGGGQSCRGGRAVPQPACARGQRETGHG